MNSLDQLHVSIRISRRVFSQEEGATVGPVYAMYYPKVPLPFGRWVDVTLTVFVEIHGSGEGGKLVVGHWRSQERSGLGLNSRTAAFLAVKSVPICQSSDSRKQGSKFREPLLTLLIDVLY